MERTQRFGEADAGEAAVTTLTGIVQRCPFCHESVSVEVDAWVACQQCLARHHGSCWGESSRCGSCGNEGALVAAERAPAPADRPPVEPWRETTTERASLLASPLETTATLETATPRVGADTHEIRRATLRLLSPTPRPRPWGRVARSVAAAVFMPLTLGVTAIAATERAILAHARRNRADFAPLPSLPRDVRDEVERTRERATGHQAKHAIARFALIGVPSALLLFATLHFWISTFAGPPDSRDSFDAYPTQALAAVAFFIYLHVTRERVRRHEKHQVTAALVAHGLPPAPSLVFVSGTRANWMTRRLGDMVLMLMGLIPGVGLLAIPLVAVRLRGTLELHELHETALVDRLKKSAAARETQVVKGS